MKAIKHGIRALAHLSFLAFIVIQIAPAWAKVDYSKTDSPCPLHAIRMAQIEKLEHMAAAAQHSAHSDSMPHTMVMDFAEHDHHHGHDMAMMDHADMNHPNEAEEQDQPEKDNPKPFSCPYCTVREIAYLPADYILVPAPRETVVGYIIATHDDTVRKTITTVAYQSRAPPVFS